MNSAKLENPAVGSIVNILPDNIELGRNGRWDGLKDIDVNDLIEGFKRDGQLQPVMIWYDPKGKPHLEFGFRRWYARNAMNEGLDASNKIPLICLVCERPDPVQAFLKNVSENMDRKDLSPMDKAFGQDILRRELKQENIVIAKAYHCTPAMISILSNLLLVIPDVQACVHFGLITVNEAVKMVREKWTKKDQMELVTERLKAAGKTLGELTKGTRKPRKEKEKGESAKAKNWKQIISALKTVCEFPEVLPSVINYCAILSEWIASEESPTDLIVKLTGKTKKQISEMEKSSEDAAKQAEEEFEDEDSQED